MGRIQQADPGRQREWGCVMNVGLGTDLPGGCAGLWFLHLAVLQQPETFINTYSWDPPPVSLSKFDSGLGTLIFQSTCMGLPLG